MKHSALAGRDTRLVVLRVLFTLCTAGAIVFIFANSLQDAAASSARSAQATAALNRVAGAVGLPALFSETVVRKLAHLAEYTLLGFFLMLTLRVYTKRIVSHISWPLFFGLAIPVADEMTQALRPGRSSEVRDVAIDFAGVVCGVAAALFVLLVVRMVTVLRRAGEPL